MKVGQCITPARHIVEPGLDHPPEPVALLRKQLDQRPLVAEPDAIELGALDALKRIDALIGP